MQRDILSFWLVWHFFEAPKEIIQAWKNFLLFNLHYFSIPTLLRTFFSYWHKYSWSYGRGFDLKVWVEVALSNIISRVIGAIVRSILIALGLLSELSIFLAGFIVLLTWLLLPFLFIAGIILGLNLII
ncbi:MAG: ATPase AAA-2 domain-containing protein [Parcubacteria group bacterium GW2011_GWC1_38_6]|nr:MAG: ATPase AAA-2 domain-containing protein [Parcubacteria group bacterium GW2011_GWC1_38_6]